MIQNRLGLSLIQWSDPDPERFIVDASGFGERSPGAAFAEQLDGQMGLYFR
jgi:hypothetical protein